MNNDQKKATLITVFACVGVGILIVLLLFLGGVIPITSDSGASDSNGDWLEGIEISGSDVNDNTGDWIDGWY